MSEEIVLKVENLIKYFQVGKQNIEILRGISFEVKRGDFVIIFGPSGSGKSTLLHVMLGLEEPSSGNVIFLGEDFYKGKDEDDRAERRKSHMGMVYQQPNWVKSLSVVENVSFPLILLGKDKSEAIETAWKSLQKLQMHNWVGYKPTELSGGQQQKVALARALITNPEVIVADEPTGNLDFESGQELMNTLTKLNDEGRTIIMVTHDLEYLKYAKTAIQFLDGRVVGIFNEAQRKIIAANVQTKRGAAEQIENNVQSTKINTGELPTNNETMPLNAQGTPDIQSLIGSKRAQVLEPELVAATKVEPVVSTAPVPQTTPQTASQSAPQQPTLNPEPIVETTQKPPTKKPERFKNI